MPQTELTARLVSAGFREARATRTHGLADTSVTATKENSRAERYSVETIEAMQKHLLGYRDNLRVEVESSILIVARTAAELRTLSTWPGRLVLDVHIDLDPRPPLIPIHSSDSSTEALAVCLCVVRDRSSASST